MIVDITFIREAEPEYFGPSTMRKVRDYQKLGYRVEVQYGSDYKALVIARECDWIGNNN